MQQTSPARPTPVRTVVPRLTRPPWVDIVLAAVFVVLTVAEAVLNPEVPSVGRHLLVSGVAMMSLAFRRQAPILVGVLVMVAHVVSNPQGELSVILSLVLVCFTIGSEVPSPRSYLGLGLLFVPFVGAMAWEGLEPSDLAAALVFLVGPWSVGCVVRQRALRTEEAEARAVRLESEQAAAVQAERTRIARELHDIVSHSISVVTIQTQAVRRRLGPEHQAEVDDLAAVEATAREALAEMRRLFGVLRADGEAASLAPQPGLAELSRLAAGESLLAPGVTRRVIDAFVSRAALTRPRRDAALDRLTPRELEVLGLLARGLSNLDIAQRLFVSEGTTKTHVSNVLAKLGLRDRVHAVIYAYENGVVVAGRAAEDLSSD